MAWLHYLNSSDDVIGIRVLNRTLGDPQLAKHSGKTAMGKVERGFDCPGYHFTTLGLSLAPQTLTHCADKPLRLYKEEPPHTRVKRLREYLRRWRCRALSDGLAGALPGSNPVGAVATLTVCGDGRALDPEGPCPTGSHSAVEVPHYFGYMSSHRSGRNGVARKGRCYC